jgi:ribosomal protein S18 acetylase RimI-like enzyme
VPSLTTDVAVTDLDPADRDAVNAAAILLAQSVHESISGLVPYHASGYVNYLKAALEPPASFRTVLVRTVVLDGVPVGAADWRLLPRQLFLNGIAVAEHARGRGLARRLMTDGIRIAEGMGLSQLGLDVVTENWVAMDFYRRMGFVVTGESCWYDVPSDASDPTATPPEAVDWPAFRAHVTAYGFGDLTVRGKTGGSTRIRQVGRNLRIDAATPAAGVLFYKEMLGATRVVSATAHGSLGGDFPFSRSARMIREHHRVLR